MDILDEIDAAIHEKRSKWKYTPMREKSETDAIIDELLREFPSSGYESGKTEYQPQESISAEPAEQERNYIEDEPYIMNDEQQERQQYEQMASENNDGRHIAENNEYIQSTAYARNGEYIENPEYAGDAVYNGDEEYAEEPEYQDTAYDEDSAENPVGQNIDDSQNDDSSEVTEESGSDEYNEYISQKYAAARYEEDEDGEEPLYNDDEYDGEDDDEFEEYQEEMPEESGKKKNTDKDFNSFMDAENDGEKGDIPKFSISSAVLTILKILILAAFGALAVVGIINTVSIGVDKYNKIKGKPETNLKEELQSVIYPVVVTETEDFTDISGLTNEQIINIAVWEVVINGNKSVFVDKDSGDCLIPQDQMTYIIDKLFGDDAEFEHSDSGIGDKKIIYDKKNKQYIIPENTDLYTLHPVVTDVAQTGDVYTVYADCYTSYPPWSSVKSDEPVKRVMVTLDKTSEYYNISALKTIPLN